MGQPSDCNCLALGSTNILYCTDNDILLFLFLLRNELNVSRFGYKHLLNALNVNVDFSALTM